MATLVTGGCGFVGVNIIASVFPKFSFRTARGEGQPNIWYTDRACGLMDVGRLIQDAGSRSRHARDQPYSAYLEWIVRTPEFWSRRVSETGGG